jgi:hypothetical protein
MTTPPDQTTQRWTFRIGDVFDADDPLARFIVAVAAALNDNHLSNTLFVESEKPYEHIYFFNLASSHLYEAAEAFLRAKREWPQVEEFIASLGEERQAEFERISALARPDADWPGSRLKTIRNSFFHYLRLDRAAAGADQLPLMRGLREAEDLEGVLTREPGTPLALIRAFFADEISLQALVQDFDEQELERLAAVLGDYQADLNRFAQGAVGRFLRDQPEGVVSYEETDGDGGET